MLDARGEPLPDRLETPRSGALLVWWTTIDVGADALARSETAVDAATLARADRMRREADRRRVLVAHALLRRLLSAAVGVPPAEIVLSRHCAACDADDHGRPFLPGGPSFGISHGGDIAVVVLGAPDACAAVDVERVQPPERWDAVRAHAFSDAEWAATAGDPSAGRTALWARKEAAVKATGHGLSLDLRRVHFTPVEAQAAGAHADPTAAGFAIEFDDGDPPAPPGQWFAADVSLADDHHAAVAARTDAVPRVVISRAAL